MLHGHTHAGLQARLARRPQASFFSPADKAAIEDGSVQSAELTHCNWSTVGGVTSVPLLEDMGHKGQLHLISKDAMLKCIAQQLCRSPLPCPRPAVIQQGQS